MRVTSLLWWTVLLPTTAIILLDYTRHKLLAGFAHPWHDEAVLLVGVLLVAFATSQLLISRIERSQRQEQESEMLRQIGMEITSSLELDAVLSAILQRGRDLLGADCLGIALPNTSRRELILQADGFPSPRRLPAPPGVDFPWETMESGESRELLREAAGSQDNCPACRRCLALPLRMGSQQLGALCVGSCAMRSHSPEERRLAGQMANLAAVALANSLLHERAQNLATLQERDRIAREVHDSLAQVLGYLSMKVRATRELLREGEVEEVETALLEVGQVADDGYVDAREAILGLRTSARPTGGLKGVLDEYLQKFSRQSGVAARLIVREGSPFDLPASTEIQLVRVIQEALTNVRKHAHASNAWVELEWSDGVGRVTVGDDGRGFDPTHAENQVNGSYGIAAMRERMAKVGGHLAVESQPGRGATVVATIPLEPGKREGNDHG
ncbi:MAG: GAF domain-containing sensor histidine kinase [Chloroflexota bacterium]